ncbi:MAG: siphovirus Gp157 family protein [Hyphomicrobiaceae bacterium]|nr:siphovirus Gp157 family protein [Hyphomicrobiaceae bacterium]
MIQPKKPTVGDLLDQASMLVQTCIVSGVPIPIDLLSQWEGETEDKLSRLYYVAKRIDSNKEVVDAEIERLQARSKRYGRESERVKGRAGELMVEYTKVTGREKCKTPQLTFSVETTRAVLILDESKIPAHLLRSKSEVREPSKTLIRELLDQGKDIPGALLTINHHIRWR